MIYLAIIPIALSLATLYYRWAAGIADGLRLAETVRADKAEGALKAADAALQAARSQNVTLTASADRALGEANRWRSLATAKMSGDELAKLAEETFK